MNEKEKCNHSEFVQGQLGEECLKCGLLRTTIDNIEGYHQSEKCDCAEISCKDGCTRDHTCKTFRCEKFQSESIDLDEMVRDFTQVFPRPKSEVRRRINQAIASAVEARESKLSESVEKMKKARPTGAECVNHPESAAWDEVCVIHNNALDQVLSIINPSNE